MEISDLKREDLPQYKSLIDECFGTNREITYYQEHYLENGGYRIIIAKES